MKRLLSALCGLLLVGAFASRELSLSRRHPAPLFDEVAYLDQARGFAAEGGVLAGVACHLRLRCLEDNRHPLYALAAAALMAAEPEPADFARAKLLTLACGLLLLGAVFAAGARLGGLEAGLAALALLALSGETAALSNQVAADVLFAALYVAALAVLARAGTDRRQWALFGALAGLAYLAKASGQFLLLSAAAVALRRWGKGAWRRPEPWLALVAFAAAAAFLLYRNAAVWGNPFHNVNTKAVWMDHIAQEWPEIEVGWRDMGPLQYWRGHTLGEAGARLAGGALTAGLTLVAAAAAGPLQPSGLATAALGLAVLFLLARGARAAWKAREKDAVLGPAAAALPMLAGLSWGAAASMVGTRFMLPLAASFAPLAAFGVKPRVLRAAIAGAALIAAAALARARDGFTADPRSFWAVDAAQDAASRYVAASVDANGFLLPYASAFSTWDRGRDKRHLFPYVLPDEILLEVMSRHGIRHLFVDRDAPSSLSPARRLGRADVYGPTSYMGWPRCWHDALTPSRLLAFAPACGSVPTARTTARRRPRAPSPD